MPSNATGRLVLLDASERGDHGLKEELHRRDEAAGIAPDPTAPARATAQCQ